MDKQTKFKIAMLNRRLDDLWDKVAENGRKAAELHTDMETTLDQVHRVMEAIAELDKQLKGEPAP